jgi:hypothetical protein
VNGARIVAMAATLTVSTRAAKVFLFYLGLLLVAPYQESLAWLDPPVAAKQIYSPIGTGRITGRVIVAGSYKKPKPLPVFKDRSFCGARVPNETLLVGREGGLRNAIVTLHPVDRKGSAEPIEVVLDNKRCALAPHVQVATLGSELLLKNSDPILHTVHARIGQETLFNIGLPTWRQVTKRLNRLGVVRIDCDVLHTWMSAAIIVTDTPYFAVSDQNGNFLIERLPAGEYHAEIWHEKLGSKTVRVALYGNGVTSLFRRRVLV